LDCRSEGIAVDFEPVQLLVLGFPGERADPAVAGILAEAVSRGYVTVLDLAFLTRTPDGLIRVTGVDANLDRVGLGSLEIRAQALISEDHLGVLRDSLKPGTSAAVIAYEHNLARRLSGAAREAGGAVILHGQVDRGPAQRAQRDQQLAAYQQQQAVAESEAAVRQAEAEAAAAERAAEKYANLRPHPPAGADDLVSQLADLARLRESGALSAAEFESAKAKLLGS
jgi:Family of unknown function (DUF6325)/Short C-terminal domain